MASFCVTVPWGQVIGPRRGDMFADLTPVACSFRRTHGDMLEVRFADEVDAATLALVSDRLTADFRAAQDAAAVREAYRAEVAARSAECSDFEPPRSSAPASTPALTRSSRMSTTSTTTATSTDSVCGCNDRIDALAAQVVALTDLVVLLANPPD